MNKVSQNKNQSSLSLFTQKNQIIRCQSGYVPLLWAVFLSFLLAGCIMPTSWIDDSDFQNNLPDNSILAYDMRWGYESPEIRARKQRAGYEDDFLKMFPLGDSVMQAKKYLMDIGANCRIPIAEKETIDTCVYRRKVKVYTGYFEGNLGAEKTLMFEGWINVIYKINSRQGSITGIIVDTTYETVYQYSVPPDENRDKEIENCRPPECIRKF